jgi:hypothetical protein
MKPISDTFLIVNGPAKRGTIDRALHTFADAELREVVVVTTEP